MNTANTTYVPEGGSPVLTSGFSLARLRNNNYKVDIDKIKTVEDIVQLIKANPISFTINETIVTNENLHLLADTEIARWKSDAAN